jgi:hypothetical protein
MCYYTHIILDLVPFLGVEQDYKGVWRRREMRERRRLEEKEDEPPQVTIMCLLLLLEGHNQL